VGEVVGEAIEVIFIVLGVGAARAKADNLCRTHIVEHLDQINGAGNVVVDGSDFDRLSLDLAVCPACCDGKVVGGSEDLYVAILIRQC